MNLVPYNELRNSVRNGDLLLWRATTIPGRIICLGTSLRHRQRIRHSHASMAAWGANGRLYNLEMIQWYGGRHVWLSGQVDKFPRSCEVWRPIAPRYDGYGAVQQMLWLMGQHYGWANFIHLAVRTMFPHIILPKPKNSIDPDQPLVCSSAYSWAARTGGQVSPCPNKSDIDITPADLALSGFAHYLATPISSRRMP
ncbi:MAG TPA: hypothetical protein VM537_07540 [Anaerolineae bacterium]|nr:hypothetical protein [Anaerolineae bacterium]